MIACRESLPDVDDLVRRFPGELARLAAAVDARPPEPGDTDGSLG